MSEPTKKAYKKGDPSEVKGPHLDGIEGKQIDLRSLRRCQIH
ncbi:MAG: hypothetical protein R3A47_03700 [Polyangiales bacterium]